MKFVLKPNISSANSKGTGCRNLLGDARPLNRPFRTARCEVKAERVERDVAFVERRGILLASAAALTSAVLPWEGHAEGESEPSSVFNNSGS